MRPITQARLTAVPLALGVVAVVTGYPAPGLALMAISWMGVFLVLARKYSREVGRHASH